MQKNAGEKPLRWLGKTNLRSKNSTPAEPCQEKVGMFMEVNFLAEGAAKPLGNTAQFPPDGLSTVPAAAALRIMRHCP